MFLLPKNLEVTSAAKGKIIADFWLPPDSPWLPSIDEQITVLSYVEKSVTTSKAGNVEKRDYFRWGAYFRSSVPVEALWLIDGHQLAIKDDRWQANDRLVLDVHDGDFRIKKVTI